MFLYLGFWKWQQPVYASAEGMAFLVARKHIENSACPAGDAWSDYPGWDYPCTAVFHSGPHLAVLASLKKLKETWRISAASNLKTTHASKCLQDRLTKAGAFKLMSARTGVWWTTVAAVHRYGLSTSCPSENKMMLRAIWTATARKPLLLQWWRHLCCWGCH